MQNLLDSNKLSQIKIRIKIEISLQQFETLLDYTSLDSIPSPERSERWSAQDWWSKERNENTGGGIKKGGHTRILFI